jgi:hypothetical protein
MRAPAWEFAVHATHEIAGRGVAVFGVLSGEIRQRVFRAVVDTPEGSIEVGEASVEFALLSPGVEEPALLLREASEAEIPVGSVVRQDHSVSAD